MGVTSITNTYLDLFLTFTRVGLFTFGGGYAMIPVVENACVEKKHWITHDDMMNVTVIAESTPGPIAINCATFVGYRQKGLLGALAATVGMVLPSFVVIFLISLFLDRFIEIKLVASAFRGIKLAVGILIIDAGVRMIKKMPKKTVPLILLGCAFTAMIIIDFFSLNFSSIYLMLAAAAAGLVISALRNISKTAGGERE